MSNWCKHIVHDKKQKRFHLIVWDSYYNQESFDYVPDYWNFCPKCACPRPQKEFLADKFFTNEHKG